MKARKEVQQMKETEASKSPSQNDAKVSYMHGVFGLDNPQHTKHMRCLVRVTLNLKIPISKCYDTEVLHGYFRVIYTNYKEAVFSGIISPS